jgi:hypothetical protein
MPRTRKTDKVKENLQKRRKRVNSVTRVGMKDEGSHTARHTMCDAHLHQDIYRN